MFKYSEEAISRMFVVVLAVIVSLGAGCIYLIIRDYHESHKLPVGHAVEIPSDIPDCTVYRLRDHEASRDAYVAVCGH